MAYSGDLGSHVLEVMEILSRLSGILSCCTSLFIIILYAYFDDEIRSLSAKSIFWLCVSDLLGCVCIAIGKDGVRMEGHLCQIQAFGIQQFILSGVIWTSIIACQAYVKLFYDITEQDVHMWIYHLTAWCIPLATNVLLIQYEKTGDAELWCWVKKEETVWTVYTFYCPLIVCFIVNVVLYGRIVCRMRQVVEQRRNSSHDREVDKLDHIRITTNRRVFYFLTSFVLIWIWGVINTIRKLLNPENSEGWMYFVYAFTFPLVRHHKRSTHNCTYISNTTYANLKGSAHTLSFPICRIPFQVTH